MKPFDLKQAKSGLPIVTRDGRPARFIAHVPECSYYWRVIAHICDSISTTSYTESGQLFGGREYASELFMAPTKREAWVNVHSGTVVNGPFLSESIARSFALPNFIACCRIEWEE